MKDEIIENIRSGEVVVFPTETFFGLGADPFLERAVSQLLEFKGRPGPIPLILDDASRFSSWVKTDGESDEMKSVRKRLIAEFWPGPLTLIINPTKHIASSLAKGVAAEDGSVAVRVSSNTVSTALAKAIGGAVTSTSANPKGAEPPLTSAQAKEYFPDLKIVEGVTDTKHTKPSTILDVRTFPFVLIREGAISRKTLEEHGNTVLSTS